MSEGAKDESNYKEGSQDESPVFEGNEVAEVADRTEASTQLNGSSVQTETVFLKSNTVTSNIDVEEENRSQIQDTVPSVGNRDLNPFPGIDPYPQVYPSMDTNDRFHRGPGMPGNEIGPSHPIFDPRSNVFEDDRFSQPRFDPSGSSRFLQPRFDPLVPFGGANAPDFGNPNFLRGGRGFGGRGRGPTRYPGEPNPDHLRPPGYDSDFI